MKLSVVAHPNSKKQRVEFDLFGQMHVYVSAPPLEGKANTAIVKLLAEHFGVKKSNVVLVSGQKSKNKVFEIVALTIQEV